MSTRDLVIFGSGGFAREVAQVVHDINAAAPTWNLLGFLDGDPAHHGDAVHGLPVLGGPKWLDGRSETWAVIAIGSTGPRRRVARQLVQGGTRFATLVHPRAWIGANVHVGAGSIVCAGNMITTDVRLGEHVILNLGCTVGHDATLEDFCTVAPAVNVSGAVRLGEGCDLGTNSTVIQGIAIGAWSVVGAGAVVVRDLPPNVTAVGIPARAIKERPPGWHEA